MEERVRALLKKNRLSITESRMEVLTLFYKAPGALAHADIEKKTGSKMDRVTIYRTLQVFEEKGLIHTIPTSDNSVKYALCKEKCAHGHHHDNHVHFICNRCTKTICLDDVLVPEVKLPKGFSPIQSNMVVNGLCDACKS